MKVVFIIFIVFAFSLCRIEKVEEDNTDLCDICKYVVGYVEKFIEEEKTEEEIEKLLESVCSIIPYHEECKHVVEKYLPIIIEFIKEKLPADKICQLIGLCPKKKEKEEVVENIDLCKICMFIVETVQEFLVENKTEEEIKKELEHVCALIPYTDECISLVDEYLPLIIDLLENLLPPQKVCVFLRLCKKKNMNEINEVEDACEICKIIVPFVDDLIKDHKTVEEIEKALEKVCALLPKEFQNECKHIVDNYTPKICEWVSTKTSDEICELLKLCPPKPEVCDLCVILVTSVEDFLKDNKTEKEIIQEVQKICPLLPQQYLDICNFLIEEEIPAIIDLLEKKFEANYVCKELKYCNA